MDDGFPTVRQLFGLGRPPPNSKETSSCKRERDPANDNDDDLAEQYGEPSHQGAGATSWLPMAKAKARQTAAKRGR